MSAASPRLRIAALAALALLAACSAPADAVDPPPGNATRSPTDNAEDLAVPTYTVEQVAAARALCGLPPSPVVPLTSVQQEVSLLDGSWLLCPPALDAGSGGNNDTAWGVDLAPYVGVRLTLSQGIYGLVSNDDGSVTLAANVGYPVEQPYDIQPFPGRTEDNVAGQIWSPYFGGYPAIETSPRRITAGGLSGALVYLGP